MSGETRLKYKVALAGAYRAGLSVSEVKHLKVSDIDSQRMLLRVENSRGGRAGLILIAGGQAMEDNAGVLDRGRPHELLYRGHTNVRLILTSGKRAPPRVAARVSAL